MPNRLIVCCDGTWNTADQAISGHPSPTNVTKLALSIAPEDAAGARQCVYYHSGVGTSRWERLSGGAFGVGLSRNVLDAYHFLVDNYRIRRLAVPVRVHPWCIHRRGLAGLIRNSGVLRRKTPTGSARPGPFTAARPTRRAVSHRPCSGRRTRTSHDPAHRRVDTVSALGIPALGPRWLQPIVTRINHRWDSATQSSAPGQGRVPRAGHRRTAGSVRADAMAPAAGADGQELKQVWFTRVRCDISSGCPDTSLLLTSLCCGWPTGRARTAWSSCLAP